MHFNTATIMAAAAVFSTAVSAVVIPPYAVAIPNITVNWNTTSCSEECRSVREAYEADEGHANQTLTNALNSCLHACELNIKLTHKTLSVAILESVLLESILYTDELRQEIFEMQLKRLRRELDFMELAYGRMVSTASSDKRCGLVYEKFSSALLDPMLLAGFSMVAEQLASMTKGAANATQPSDDSGVEASNAQPDEEVAKEEFENKATL
ncbi:hypothetical protein LTS10_011868 [Elasticomyces elasticus]|nr:hypothetical protein LTS10_011868 [Elasticomyces elasticus]